MPLSMTGFGRFETTTPRFSHVWEIKSVNGRFLDVKWRLPAAMRSSEIRWERMLRGSAARGRLDVSLDLEVMDPELLGVKLNRAVTMAMLSELERLAEEKFHLSYTPDFNRLLTVPALWRDHQSGEPDQGLVKSLDAGLQAALDDWNAARAVEGANTARDLHERMAVLHRVEQEITERVPVLLEEKKGALAERIREGLAAAGASFSEDRMLQEIALLADRLDVNEELTRLAEHLRRLEEVLGQEGEVGKRLDFLLQEAFREINTCGNKCQDAHVSALVVEFKAELEKCREQVQNIE